MSHHPTVSVILPARNEAANLSLLLPQLPAGYEVVLVDGHSADETVAVARALRPDVVVVHQTRRGKGNALVCGFRAASGDIVVSLDADCSADPAEVPRLVEALVAGADFATGSRFTPGGGSEDFTPVRRWASRGVNLVASTVFGVRLTDVGYGYQAFWRDLLPVLRLGEVATADPAGGPQRGDGTEIAVVISCRFAAAGARLAEVPSVERRRAFDDGRRASGGGGLRSLRTVAAEGRPGRRGGRRSPQRDSRAPAAPPVAASALGLGG